jgi:hypothetical protein
MLLVTQRHRLERVRQGARGVGIWWNKDVWNTGLTSFYQLYSPVRWQRSDTVGIHWWNTYSQVIIWTRSMKILEVTEDLTNLVVSVTSLVSSVSNAQHFPRQTRWERRRCVTRFVRQEEGTWVHTVGVQVFFLFCFLVVFSTRKTVKN